jgi:magnesium chelatase family protein
MSFAKIYSVQHVFLAAQIVTIEVDLSRGLHSFSMVGLPNKAVEEARDRISAAIKNSGFVSPKQKNQKVVVSLAPADIKKEGPHFDLGIALCYLKAAGDISFNGEQKIFLGELALDGAVRKIQGALGLVIEAKQKGFCEIYVPKENLAEVSLVHEISFYGISTLEELIQHLQGTSLLEKYQFSKNIPNIKTKDGKDGKPTTSDRQVSIGSESKIATNIEVETDFSHIIGQENAKRALEIAAAGKHNIMLYGPPGTGKTMLAKAFPHILPRLSYEETIEVTSIHSIAGLLTETLIVKPPVRQPHHTSSANAIIGGGNPMRAGEITLAHRGVLIMDEFPEFDRRVIEALRQPLEEHKISVVRTKGSIVFPSDFILIATMNPCPCGYYQSKEKLCTCTHTSLRTYRMKISGPIMDRIDLWVSIDLQKKKIGEKSTKHFGTTQEMQNRVFVARTIQKNRFECRPGTRTNTKTNGRMNNQDIRKYIKLGIDQSTLLNAAADQLSFSMRNYYRTIKIARTIADLAGSKEILENHLLEAIQYRPGGDFAN